MTKPNKYLTDSRTLFRGFTYGLLCTGLLAFVALSASRTSDQTDTTEESSLISIKRTADSVADTTEAIYDGLLSPVQIQADMDAHFGFSPDFSKSVAESKDDTESPDERSTSLSVEKQNELLTAYLDGMLLQQQEYNQYIQTLTKDLQYAEVLGSDYLTSPMSIDNWSHPLLDAMRTITDTTPLFIHGDDETYHMFVDYDAIQEQYGEWLSPFHQNLMRLHKDIARFGYSRDDGRVDADILYHRLLLIDDIQDGNRSKDGFYWEEERFQLVSLFVGYGSDTRPVWDEKRMEQLEAIADYDLHNPYCDVASILLESIDDEGEYGPQTVRLVNDWVVNEFTDYLDFLESANTD